MNESPATRRYEREPAKRVFAAELREATHHFRDGTEDMSPTYTLLPSGERCNRVFLVGTMTEKKRSEGEAVFYQVRVMDPTGLFFVSAGSYQPEALHQISSIEAPNFIAVIGKPNAYQAPDGRTLVSVRAESVALVDQDIRDTWILDTAECTLDRLDSQDMTPDRQKAQEIYSLTPAVLRKTVKDALERVQI